MRVGNPRGRMWNLYQGLSGQQTYTLFHRAVGWTVSTLPRRSAAVWADDLLDMGTRPEKKWWFDLEDVDGILQIPRQREKKRMKLKRLNKKKRFIPAGRLQMLHAATTHSYRALFL